MQDSQLRRLLAEIDPLRDWEPPPPPRTAEQARRAAEQRWSYWWRWSVLMRIWPWSWRYRRRVPARMRHSQNS